VQWLVEGSRKQHASAEWCVTYGTQQLTGQRSEQSGEIVLRNDGLS